jgi:ketosteroid isomerase-like protein
MSPGWIGAIIAAVACGVANASMEEDRKAVYGLDIQYQAAVERNDDETMSRIHHENMTLVLSNGTVVTGAQLEQAARDKARTYERQVVVDDSRVVRVLSDTAVVTAKLWLKGTRANGEAFDYKLWFSDTYVRTPTGWRYFFGQAGAPLPR